MPCRDSSDEDDIAEAYRKIDKLTDLLCQLCQEANNYVTFPTDVRKWWKKHQDDDAARARAEELEKQRKKEARKKTFERLKKEFES